MKYIKDLKLLTNYGFKKRILHERKILDDGEEVLKPYEYYYKKIIYVVDKKTGYAVDGHISFTENDRKIYLGSYHMKYEYELYKKMIEETILPMIQDNLIDLDIEKGE